MNTRNWSSTLFKYPRGFGRLCAVLASGLLCCGLHGCGGGAPKQAVTSQRAPHLAPPDTLAARTFSLAQDTVLAPLLADWPQVEPARKRDSSQASDSAAETVAMVYRVQLYTTKDLGTAQAVGKEAEADFGQKVQIDYEVPYYKVRVGVFVSPQAAEPVLQEARRKGYRGAWAVRVRASEQAP